MAARKGKPSSGPFPTTMAFGAALAVALVSGILFAPGLLGLVRGSPDGEGVTAAGYEQLVNGLIAPRGWLSVLYGDNGEAAVGLAETRVARDQRLVKFVNSSYLRQDFGDAGLWELSDDGRRVKGISRFAHMATTPFVDGKAWRGDLLFRDEFRDIVSLSHGGQTIEFAPDGAPSRGCDIRLFAPGQDLRGQREYTVCRGHDSVATIVLVGDRVLVRSSAKANQVNVEVGAVAIEQQDSTSIAWRLLEPNATVTFRSGARNESFVLSQTAAAISRWTAGGRVKHPGLEGFGDSVAFALSGKPRQARITTLDRDFQTIAQASLDTVADDLAEQTGGTFRGAVTIMDASSGEVLAMASYPARLDSLPPALRRVKRGRALVERNHNLDLLPIGSVAKAPISMAILQADPRPFDQGLASFRLRPAGAPFHTLLGMDLGAQFPADHSSAAGLIDYPRFLEVSSNKYALGLMMMAFGEQPGGSYAGSLGSELYEIGGRPRQDAPQLAILRNARPGDGGAIPNMEVTPPLTWTPVMARMFSVSVEGRSCGYELGVWRGWIGAGAPCRSSFAAASPETESLGLNNIHDLAADYLMTILGGSRSSWSTVKVAEMFSRIVTGSMTSARFTRVPPDEIAVDALPVRPEVRRIVLEGLGRVVTQGTGKGLRSESLGYGPNVRFFAKTGTPNVDDVEVTPASRALQTLAGARCELMWDPQARRLGFDGLVDRGAIRAWIAEEMEPRCREIIEGSSVAADTLIDEMSYIARQPLLGAGGLPLGVRHDGFNMVTAVPSHQQTSRAGTLTPTGHVFAVVVGRYLPGAAPDAKPQRALTIVVNLQRRRRGTPALEVAKQILSRPEIQLWLAAEPEAPNGP
jgi:hypothetical protein